MLTNSTITVFFSNPKITEKCERVYVIKGLDLSPFYF